MSNNIGLPSVEKGTLQFGLSYDYNNLNTLKNGRETLDDNARLRTTKSILLNIGYTITSNLSIEALLTWVHQTRRINQFGNINLDETKGIGDGLLLLKYNFNAVLNGNNTLRIGLGTKIPLGATDKKSKQNILFNADLQPGSNAWDAIFWTSYLQKLSFRPTASFSATAVYRATGTNPDYLNFTSYKFGPEFQFFINYSDQFLVSSTIINPGLSLKYRKTTKDEIGKISLDNTGGEWIMVVPSFDILIKPNLTFQTKFEIPIYSNVDGTQLTPTSRFTAGLFYTISNRKRRTINLKQSL